ncbi:MULTISPECIES: hypothetical protein [unclassified Mesorhizobium]|uniref:hypothetical protein n=1 Tax=unclassified Mesorhizobium TaxID=325217 RepID=UPI001CC9DE40|nr:MULTISPECIES: hypothetical protein [unclassified Mesorhizobium]MBZ9845943.1 hypothetical protein [Mesorhizobium sp. CA5]MBZ9861973.1 hypothetical protein [Mesorhizobium sp. CA12]
MIESGSKLRKKALSLTTRCDLALISDRRQAPRSTDTSFGGASSSAREKRWVIEHYPPRGQEGFAVGDTREKEDAGLRAGGYEGVDDHGNPITGLTAGLRVSHRPAALKLRI